MQENANASGSGKGNAEAHAPGAGDAAATEDLASVTIRTERFGLRPMTEADLVYVLGWWNDPEVRAAHALGAEPLALWHVQAWFAAEESRPHAWIVEPLGPCPETEPLGMLELAAEGGTDGSRRAGAGQVQVLELGVTLRADARGQGIGREVVEGLARWAIGNGHAARVELTVLRSNARAIRAFVHAGFRPVSEPSAEGGRGTLTLRMVYDPTRKTLREGQGPS